MGTILRLRINSLCAVFAQVAAMPQFWLAHPPLFNFMASRLWPKPNSAFCMDELSVHFCELKSCAELTYGAFVGNALIA